MKSKEKIKDSFHMLKNKINKKIINIPDLLRVTPQKLGGLPIKNSQRLPSFLTFYFQKKFRYLKQTTS